MTDEIKSEELDLIDNYKYTAPRIKLDVGEFAQVKGEAKTWETFPCGLQGKENEMESRMPIRILSGANEGALRTIRTRSDAMVFDTYDLAGKQDLFEIEFWIMKVEKRNSRGTMYNMYTVSKEKPNQE